MIKFNVKCRRIPINATYSIASWDDHDNTWTDHTGARTKGSLLSANIGPYIPWDKFETQDEIEFDYPNGFQGKTYKYKLTLNR